MQPIVLLPPLRRSLIVVWALPAPTGRSADAGEPAVDPDDLSRLVTEYGEAIYRVALSVVRDRATAEDVAQDTLVKAWVALPTFRGDASLKSWVLRIAHNTAISTLRTRRSVVMDPFTMPETATPQDRSVERRVENTAAMSDFVDALGELDELSRSVVVLREVEGLHYDEICQILDVPLSTVKTRLMRARRRLGSALEEWAP
jgi:RNA polymerase sigma-70 factor (ECF subfamily)